MRIAVVAIPGCFDSGLTSVLDVLRVAETLRPGLDVEIPALEVEIAGFRRHIKTAGGTTFTQDESAEVSGMPLSAQASGFVDFVLSPDKIPAELVRLKKTFKNEAGGDEIE